MKKLLVGGAVLGFAGAAVAATPFMPTTGDGIIQAVADAKAAWQETSEPQEIVLAKGRYETPTEIVLDFPVVFRGATGNPADVVIATPQGAVAARKFTVDCADALLASLTVTGGKLNYDAAIGLWRYGSGVRVAKALATAGANRPEPGSGGVVSNCVFTGNSIGYKHCTAVVYVNGPADKALVTSCVVTNNTVTRQYDSSPSPSAMGSIVHVDSGRFANTLIKGNKATNSGGEGSASDETSILGMRGGSVENCLLVNNTVGQSHDPTLIRCTGGCVYNTVAADNVVTTNQYTRKDWDPRERFWAGLESGFTNCVFKDADVGLPNETCAALSDLGCFDFEAGDYRLSRLSPLRGTGATDGVPLTGADLLGRPRIDDQGRLDIGPIAYDPSIVKVAGVCEGDGCFEDETAVFRVTDDEGFGDDPTYFWTLTPKGGGANVTYATKDLVFETPLAFGEYAVTLSVSNLTAETGITVALDREIAVHQRTFYAKPGNPGAAAPYATEETAAGDLQTAINAVTRDGAEVVALPGVYEITTNVMVRAHQIVLRGATGNPEDVIVRNTTTKAMNTTGKDPWNELNSPYGDGRCLVLDAGPAARVESMTFENGQGLYSVHVGCGLYLADWMNRGLWPKAGRGGVVSNCVVRNCNGWSTKYGVAPGIFANGPYLVTHTVVSNCTSGAGNVNGGRFCGIGLDLGGGARAEHCLIVNNWLSYYRPAGQAYPQYGRATVGGVMVRDNSVLRFSTVVNNRGAMVGGVNVNGSDARVENCIILGNRVGNSDATAESLNCPVTTNRFNCWAMMTYAVDTDLIRGDTDFAAGNLAELTADEIAYVTAHPEAVDAAFRNTITDYAAAGATGILSSNEETFRNAAKRDYRLRSRSAAVDRVQPSAAGDMPAVDLKGDPRLDGLAYDLGCYEAKVRGMLLIVR